MELSQIPYIFLTLAVAIIGGWVFCKMKVPAGAMIGAVVFVGLFQIFTSIAVFPKGVKVVVQAIAGAFVGQRIGKKDIRELKTIILPALELFFGIAIMTLCTGFTIHKVSGMDIATSCISSVPGGIMDIAMIASDVNADPTQVTALQLVRYLIAIIILPQVDVKLCKHFCPDSVNGKDLEIDAKDKSWKNVVLTLGIGGVAAAVGKVSGVPAGALTFSMVAVAAFNIFTGKAYLPKKIRTGAQCLAGINIGVTVTLTQIMRFKELFIPAVFVAINCIAINYVLGFLIYKTNKKLDLATCLFASVPAGMADMALVSLDQGGDAPKVSVMQLVRYFCVLVVMPSVIKLIATAF